jgi:serine protease 16
MRVISLLLLLGINLYLQFTNGQDVPITKYWDIKSRPIPGTRETIFHETVSQLDHYRIQDDALVGMHVWIMDDFYQEGGPIFLYISDGRPNGQEFFSFNAGIAYNVSQEVHAALVTADLRYFWGIQPTPSLTFEDLSYLTIEQMLADISYLIVNLKRILDAPEAKVVLYGPGFGGTLATYARQKFPHLVEGVWSSSGVFSSDIFTEAPYIHLSDVIERAEPQCVDRVREAFDMIEEHIANGDGEYLQDIFYLCSPVDTESYLDVASFYENQLAFIIDFYTNYQDYANTLFCYYMEDPNLDPLEAYADWLWWFYYWFSCLEMSYDTRTELIADETWFQYFQFARQWTYLKCTQLGLFETASPANTIFRANIPPNYHISRCHDILGSQYNFDVLQTNIDRLNVEYGGTDPGITNVIFTNGLDDPWLSFGILEYEAQDAIVINITDHGRAGEMFQYDLDGPIVGPILERIREYFLQWSTPEIDPN